MKEYEKYFCTIWLYNKSLSELAVSVTSTESNLHQEFFLVFQNTIYFEGNFTWQNANYRKGSQQECAELLQHIQTPNANFLAERAYYSLFIFPSPSVDIKIVASHVFKTEKQLL